MSQVDKPMPSGKKPSPTPAKGTKSVKKPPTSGPTTPSPKPGNRPKS